MEIKFDKRNYRKHDAKNKALIKKSLEECGAGRSILVDADNELIAGNGVYEQAQKLNIPVRVVETDGTELVVVKRTDIATDDEKRKRLAVMDNSTSDSSQFDIGLLKADFDISAISDMGIDFDDVDVDVEILDPDENPEDVDPPKRVKISFFYEDSREVIDAFIEQMNKRYPEIMERCMIND